MAFILFLKSIFGAVGSSLKAAFSFLLKHPKEALVILACVAALIGGMEIKKQRDEYVAEIAQLSTKLNTANQQVTQLKIDVQTAVGVNQQNQVTIKSLSDAVVDSKNQVIDMKKVQQQNQTKIVTIREQIAESKPQDDGPVAKVLKDTINEIQKDREQAKWKSF